MIKLTGLLQDTKLYEGLIHTQDIDTTAHHLETWAVAHQKFRIKKTPKNIIVLKFGQKLTDKDFDNLYKHINNLGWFISTYRINKLPFESKKFELDVFKQDIKDHSLLTINLEAKFDLELDKYELGDLYHITPLKHKEKIDKIGLVPKTLSKIGNHPERIYLTKNEADAASMAERFGVDKEFVIYKVDVDGLRKSNNGIRFFKDPNFGGAVYTLSNIPSKFLKVYKQIKVD